ncbi:hypothetical protein BGZ96_002922, partial [Linnemannia gamsii]
MSFPSVIGDFGSVGEEKDPFVEMGLKPYSPIWLPSRAPSFEHLLRQRSYSPNPRHATTTTSTTTVTQINTTPPLQVGHVDGDDDVIVFGRQDDTESFDEFDLRDPLKEEATISSEKDLKNASPGSGKERQDKVGSSTHWYERFGNIKKRPSPLLPDHYDNLEDYDHGDGGDDDNGHRIGLTHPSLGCPVESSMPKRLRLEDPSHNK